MQERYRPLYDHALATQRKLLRLARELPRDPDAYLWRDAAAEAGQFLELIRNDDHVTKLARPATRFLIAIEEFEQAIDEFRFRQGQRAFAPRPVAEAGA